MAFQHSASDCDDITIEHLRAKGFICFSIPGIKVPLITWPGQDLQDLTLPGQNAGHPGVACDGPHCTIKSAEGGDIRGARFKCLQCEDTDFCHQCIVSNENLHEPSHIMLVTSELVQCHRFSRLDKDNEDLSKLEVVPELLEAVAFLKQCEICTLVWEASCRGPLTAGNDRPPSDRRSRFIARFKDNNNTMRLRFRPGEENDDKGVIEMRIKDHLAGPSALESRKKIVNPAIFTKRIDHPRQLSDHQPNSPSYLRRPASYSGSEECFALIRQWLKACNDTHEHCIPKIQATRPNRLLHISQGINGPIYLVKGADVVEPYVALSYCWGPDPEPLQTTKQSLRVHTESGLRIEDLPSAIRNAVEVTLNLGYKHLWIDRFCIIQDDEDDWATESVKLCDIYSDAVLTISADRSENAQEPFIGMQKCADDKYVELPFNYLLLAESHHRDLTSVYSGKSEPLHRRAWTMQERLASRRVLHFTSNELIWECDTLIQCECGLESGPSHRQEHLALALEVPEIWHMLVIDYTMRALTHQSDKYMAFSSLATRVGRAREHLDKDHRYFAGLWIKNLAADLSWMLPDPASVQAWFRNHSVDALPDFLSSSDDAFRAQKFYRAYPTWSWASMRGPVDYFRTWPMGQHTGHVEFLDYQPQTSQADKSPAHGQFGSTLKLRAHVIGSNDVTNKLKLFAYNFVRDFGDQGWGVEIRTVVRYHDDQDSFDIEFGADNPVTAKRHTRWSDSHNIMCMLLGTYAFDEPTNEALASIESMETYTSTRKEHSPRIQCSSADTLNPDAQAVVHSVEANATLQVQNVVNDPSSSVDRSSSLEPTQKSLGGFYLEDGTLHNVFYPARGADKRIHESFYLVLVPSEEYPGAWERLGCFRAGINSESRDTMAALFRKLGRQEDVTLV